MALECRQTGDTDCEVYDGLQKIAAVRSLRLVHALFRPGGRSFLGPEVPLQLFWMQYANHEDPERNAGSHGNIRILRGAGDAVSVECTGSTSTGACRSIMMLTVERSGEPVRYQYHVSAQLEVVDARGWVVTPNPDHGEVEFANLWPEGSFVKDPRDRKFFRACYVVRKEGVVRIPHHHLESPDKHNILLSAGDRFFWGVEDENPCFVLESGPPVAAGVCAYMWDAHVAFKIANTGSYVQIPKGSRFQAEYRLLGLDRGEAAALEQRARDGGSMEHAPIYVDGINRFSDTLLTPGIDQEHAWPWEREGEGLSVDLSRGVDDDYSLRIQRTGPGKSLWKATAFGPAYGLPPFAPNTRFRLSAAVQSRGLTGSAILAVRLHREGKGNLFDLSTYETYASARRVTGTVDWTMLEVLTPPISPPPDRLHLLLVQDGGGESWFDNAHLELRQ